MMPVFARRQSPDWPALARDFRAGRVIDPQRYVPRAPIPGFPPDIERIIAAWNAWFGIDFFTCRAALAALSSRNVNAVQGGAAVSHDDTAAILALRGRKKFWLFFHDDDDFFDVGMAAKLPDAFAGQADVVVTALFRVHNDLFTFVRAGKPVDFVWGRRQDFHFRFQSNNYGINAAILSPELLAGMKDHIAASDLANRLGLAELELPFVLSATVKTPCAASVVGGLLADKAGFIREMAAFGEMFQAPALPAEYAWLAAPLRDIAAIFRAVAAGRGYEALSGLEFSPGM